ncbi:MAG: hypothetical protein IKA23_08445 [Akkermansia sp.]|nr:hypothetical protein [Akkermansia sp.]MBR2314902.1 hypothetical protein [Akkermansia sp.]
MKTRTISFRCPIELVKEMEILCKHNKVDRSAFIIQALQSLFTGLADQGVCDPKPPLPPSPVSDKKPAATGE